jgi:flavin reductase (DIM6/NTAB) family NADH-FMN oxidoreductase RutF
MKTYKKRDFPVDTVRRFLEPGPIVLISSQFKGESNIMTLGWQTVISFEPSLVTLFIWDQNHSYELIRKSKECVINIPEAHMLDIVVAIGNSTGAEIDKFEEFGLTQVKASKVKAPMIKECYANFECKLYDNKLIKNYSLFVFEILKAHVAISPKYPKTVHYTGDGVFMISGDHVSRKKQFRPECL